jgi:hypothetical protein
LGIGGTAANSTLLNSQNAAYYLNYNNLTNKPTALSQFTNDLGLSSLYLGIGGTAANSTLIRGKDTSQIAQRDALNAFSENNTFSKKLAVGTSINTGFDLTVGAGGAIVGGNVSVTGSVLANTANVTNAPTSTANNQVWTVGASGALEKMDMNNILIAVYSPLTVAAQTTDIGGGVLKHLLTLDCGNYYKKTFRVNLNNVSILGAKFTFTNMRPGGEYIINYYNSSGQNMDYFNTARLQNGSTDFGTFTDSGMFTHRFTSDGTYALKAF